MSYYTYILWSESIQQFYIGSTNHIDRRLSEHNSGQSNYTKSGKPWQLVWRTKKPSKTEAIRLEMKLKNLKSQARILSFIEKYAEDKLEGHH